MTDTTQDSFQVTMGAATDPGGVREKNEDAYGHFTGPNGDDQLYVVADGMGGHVRGRKASTTAVEVIEETYFGNWAFSDRTDTVLDRLRFAFQWANGKVHAEVGSGPRGGGTTATALAISAGQAHVAHVGDSRAYRFRTDKSTQLTRDHTVVREMQRHGAITEEEARTHPRRGTLTRAIGTESTVEVDLFEVGSLQVGDRFLLCTDGLEDLPRQMLQKIVLDMPPQPAAERLVEQSIERAGHDNATALVLAVE
jgi:serine/threonine protein phosphatase PrpC